MSYHENTPLPANAPEINSPADWMKIVNDPAFDWAPIGLDYVTPEYPGERWAQHPEHEMQLSSYGRIWGRTKSGEDGFKRQSFSKGGYLKIATGHNGKRTFPYTARLVWEAFNGAVPKGHNVVNTTEMPWDSRLDSLEVYEPDKDISAKIPAGATCQRGHKITEDNVVLASLRNKGQVYCRACANTGNRDYQRRRKGLPAMSEAELQAWADRLYDKYTK